MHANAHFSVDGFFKNPTAHLLCAWLGFAQAALVIHDDSHLNEMLSAALGRIIAPTETLAMSSSTQLKLRHSHTVVSGQPRSEV